MNVRLTGKLQDFVKRRTDSDRGVFSSASEYIRDLIRHDFEKEECRKWTALKEEVAAGLEADESEFIATDASGIIVEAKRRKAASE